MSQKQPKNTSLNTDEKQELPVASRLTYFMPRLAERPEHEDSTEPVLINENSSLSNTNIVTSSLQNNKDITEETDQPTKANSTDIIKEYHSSQQKGVKEEPQEEVKGEVKDETKDEVNKESREEATSYREHRPLHASFEDIKKAASIIDYSMFLNPFEVQTENTTQTEQTNNTDSTHNTDNEAQTQHTEIPLATDTTTINSNNSLEEQNIRPSLFASVDFNELKATQEDTHKQDSTNNTHKTNTQKKTTLGLLSASKLTQKTQSTPLLKVKTKTDSSVNSSVPPTVIKKSNAKTPKAISAPEIETAEIETAEIKTDADAKTNISSTAKNTNKTTTKTIRKITKNSTGIVKIHKTDETVPVLNAVLDKNKDSLQVDTLQASEISPPLQAEIRPPLQMEVLQTTAPIATDIQAHKQEHIEQKITEQEIDEQEIIELHASDLHIASIKTADVLLKAQNISLEAEAISEQARTSPPLTLGKVTPEQTLDTEQTLTLGQEQAQQVEIPLALSFEMQVPLPEEILAKTKQVQENNATEHTLSLTPERPEENTANENTNTSIDTSTDDVHTGTTTGTSTDTSMGTAKPTGFTSVLDRLHDESSNIHLFGDGTSTDTSLDEKEEKSVFSSAFADEDTTEVVKVGVLQRKKSKRGLTTAELAALPYFQEDKEFMSKVDEAWYDQGEKSSKNLVLLFSALLLFFIGWAAFASIDEVARGQGQVIPSQRMQLLQHLEGGILNEVLVAEGDTVEPDQILARVDNVSAASSLRDIESQITEASLALIRLEAERKGIEPIFPEKYEIIAPEIVAAQEQTYMSRRLQQESSYGIIEQQIEQKKQEMNESMSRQKTYEDAYALVQKRVDIARPLVAKKLYPEVDYLNLQQEAVRLAGDISAVKNSIAKTSAEVREAEERLSLSNKEFMSEVIKEINTLRSEIATLEQGKTAGTDRVTRTELRSQVRGVVNRILLNTKGGVVKPGESIMEIVPLDDTLVIETKVRPQDIAFIHPLQKAIVRITAYDASIYGTMDGFVEQIGADTVTDEKGDVFFLIKVRTEKSAIVHHGETLPIMPGMVATVDILTGKKTILSYLLKPITKASQYALKER